MDGVQTEQDVVVLREGLSMIRGHWWYCRVDMRASSPPYLQFVDENGDGVELVVRVRRVSHGGRNRSEGPLATGIRGIE